MVQRIASLVLLWTLSAGLSHAQDSLYDKTRVHEFYFTFEQSDWWDLLLSGNDTGEDVEGDLVHDGILYPSIGLRVKGSSSAQPPGFKKPFNLSMDSFIDDQRLHGYKTINLNNGYLDPTYTREVLSYEGMSRYLPTPQTAYARVYMNGTYWGLYILAEQPNSDFLRRFFRDTNGVRYRGENPRRTRVESSKLVWYGAEESLYYDHYICKDPGHPEAWTSLVHMIDKLNHTPDAEFIQTVEPLLDIDRALWYMAICNVFHNMDSYMGAAHNYFMYFDPVDGRMNMIPWDFNLSFGTFTQDPDPWNLDPNLWRNADTRPLKKFLLRQREFELSFYAKVRQIAQEEFDWNRVLGPKNEQYQALIRQAVLEDPNKLYTLEDFDNGVDQDLVLNGVPVRALKPFVRLRRNFLLAHKDIRPAPPVITDVTFTPSEPRVGEWVQVRARATRPLMNSAPATPIEFPTVVLRVSTEGPFARIPMHDDGLHGDEGVHDGVYAASFQVEEVATQYRFYVTATANNAVAIDPPNAEHDFYRVGVLHGPPSGSVFLNELVAGNDTGDQDEAGDYDDWVEIANTGGVPFDLSEHYLTDNLENRDKWRFPDGTQIPAGGFLRVWCDDEPGEGPLHATFKLSKSGEELGLFGPDESGNPLIDAVVWGQQATDRSYGRVPDGGDDWYHVWEPSGELSLHHNAQDRIRYDQRWLGSPDGFELLYQGGVHVGDQGSFELRGGPPGAPAELWLSLGPGYDTSGPFGPVLLDPASLTTYPAVLDDQGNASVPFTVPPGFGNVVLYAQAIADYTSPAVAVRFLH